MDASDGGTGDNMERGDFERGGVMGGECELSLCDAEVGIVGVAGISDSSGADWDWSIVLIICSTAGESGNPGDGLRLYSISVSASVSASRVVASLGFVAYTLSSAFFSAFRLSIHHIAPLASQASLRTE